MSEDNKVVGLNGQPLGAEEQAAAAEAQQAAPKPEDAKYRATRRHTSRNKDGQNIEMMFYISDKATAETVGEVKLWVKNLDAGAAMLQILALTLAQLDQRIQEVPPGTRIV